MFGRRENKRTNKGVESMSVGDCIFCGEHTTQIFFCWVCEQRKLDKERSFGAREELKALIEYEINSIRQRKSYNTLTYCQKRLKELEELEA